MKIRQSLYSNVILREKWERKQNLRPETMRIQAIEISFVYPLREPFSRVFFILFLLAGVSAAVGKQAQRSSGFTH
jgi:hypothetical protein